MNIKSLWSKNIVWRPCTFWGLLLPFAVLGVATGHAATLCVNEGGTNGCSGLPSQAVAAAASNLETDVILIQAGTYAEPGAINVTEANLRILGKDPTNTKVTHTATAGVVNVFTISANSVEIAGLTITGHQHGIELTSGGNDAKIHNNHIELNAQSGIYAPTNNIRLIAFNNVINRNNAYGIEGDIYSHGGAVIVYSNIVFKNGVGGIRSATGSYNSSYNNYSVGSAWTSNYYYVQGAGSINNISGNISQDCLFVAESAFPPDYRLQATSPCKNTGNSGYSDVDGSISDMGSFGGPDAALFWPYGNGGPVITDLTIDPVIVPRGGTLSINATGEIR